MAQQEFHPDVIIGCNVSSKVYSEYPKNEDDKLISKSLLYLLLDKSDPQDVRQRAFIFSLICQTSRDLILRKPALIDSGYAQTIRMMPEIKAKVAGKKELCEDVAFGGTSLTTRRVRCRWTGLP